MRFNNEYRYTNQGFGDDHNYVVRGRHGAAQFHVHERGEHGIDTFAGLEWHYRSPPSHMADDCPSHEQCHWLGNNACWHDGTSLYAQEKLLPLWQGCKGDPAEMLKYIEWEYKSHFNVSDDEE
jgi:hypothetical protein